MNIFCNFTSLQKLLNFENISSVKYVEKAIETDDIEIRFIHSLNNVVPCLHSYGQYLIHTVQEDLVNVFNFLIRHINPLDSVADVYKFVKNEILPQNEDNLILEEIFYFHLAYFVNYAKFEYIRKINTVSNGF